MKYYTFNKPVVPNQALLTQMTRVMRITAFLLLVTLIQVSAATYAQRLTMHQNKASLKEVFKQINLQTGYDVVWDSEQLTNTSVISAHFDNMEAKDVLNLILPDQKLTYTIKDKTIVIFYLKEISIIDKIKAVFDIIDVRGRVTDKDGKPLPGTNIYVASQNKVATTDVNGKFQLSGINEKAELEISYVGYLTRKVKAKLDVGDVVLELNDSKLDEVQVIGYGTEQKRFSVGSISTVTAEQIEKQPVNNLLLALQGQVPGLAINATSGVPGSTVLAQIRGQNTLANSSFSVKPYDQPLFIIDGVPFAPQNNNIDQLVSLASTSGYTGGISQSTGISPFGSINPHDIESISMLRDADATSIYGTQGSNGVIIITTKRGKIGKTNLNLSVNTGFNSSVNAVKLLNTQQYLQYRQDAFKAENVQPSNNPTDENYAPDLTIFDKNKYTDWQKVVYGKTSNNTDIHGSISGGSGNNTFLISAGYYRSGVNYPGNYANQLASLHSSLNYISGDNRFSLDFVNDFGYTQNSSPAFGGKTLLTPNAPDLFDRMGNLVWNYNGTNLSDYQFYAYLKQLTVLQNYNFNNSFHVSYKIVDGLTFGANLGYNRNTTSEHSEDPAIAQNPIIPTLRSAKFANTTVQSVNVEPQLNYDKTIGRGILSALLGATYKRNSDYSNLIQGYGYANDGSLGSINGSTSISVFDNTSIYKYSAGFARLKYIYAQKYILSLTGRRDGSSNFGPERQFGNFGSIGAGWILSEEDGFKKALPFISYAKLSGSYGTSGSDAVKPYMFQALWQPIPYISDFQGIHPSYPENLYNPSYSWGLKKSLNIAMDLGFFENNLLLNATYYQNREGNQLAEYPLPIHTGFPDVLENLTANIQNKGWEFSATSVNIKKRNFSWTTNFNISLNHNRLLAFPGLASSSYSSRYIVGEPTSIIFGYRYKDVNPTTGLFEFYNKDGQLTSKPVYGTATTGGDEVPIGNREVHYMGGFGNNFSYMNFSLYIFFQFSSQMAPNYLYSLYGSNPLGIGTVNVPLAILNNYWKNPGDNSVFQRLSSSYSPDVVESTLDFINSSGAYSNDTYLRLKNVSLSYALPSSLLKKTHVKACSIYVNAQNLLTISNYKVGDPELFNYGRFPLQRTLAFGLNFNF